MQINQLNAEILSAQGNQIKSSAFAPFASLHLLLFSSTAAGHSKESEAIGMQN